MSMCESRTLCTTSLLCSETVATVALLTACCCSGSFTAVSKRVFSSHAMSMAVCQSDIAGSAVSNREARKLRNASSLSMPLNRACSV